jgi:diguanylate cyclase (GGDEF)-like protein
LTSLPNRSLFMDRLAHALTRTERRGEQLAILFLDLDRFKVVNDSLGHGVGDQLLIGVSQRLAACLRPEDTIARLGGDEFAILIEDVKDDKAPASVADRLTSELQQPFTVEGREVVITVSIGIAMSTARRMTPEDILRDADLAMYHAKGKGKARYEIFDKSMNAPAQERMDLELDLRNAVEERMQIFANEIVALAQEVSKARANGGGNGKNHGNGNGRVHLYVREAEVSSDELVQLRETLLEYQGPCAVSLHLLVPGEDETIIDLPDQVRVASTPELEATVQRLFGTRVSFQSLKP